MSWQDKFLQKSKQKVSNKNNKTVNNISSSVSNNKTIITNKDQKVTNRKLDTQISKIKRPKTSSKTKSIQKQIPSFIKIEEKLIQLKNENRLTPSTKILFERLVKSPQRDRYLAEKILFFLQEYF